MNIKNVNLTIRNKLLIGFGLVLILFIAISVNNFVSLGNVSEIEDRLLKLRVPTVVAGLQLADGVHLSLSGLRGYMILGKAPAAAEKFKAERQQGWQLIDGSLAKMEQFSQNWTDPKNIEMLQEMKAYVEQFRVAQQEVEDIAHSPENVPSFKLLLEEAAPRAAKVIEAITALIDEESKLEATEDRKALLKLLADSRGSFALSLANIRAYLLSGDEKFADKFHGKWKVNELRFNEISKMTYLFSPKQKQAWNTYVSYRKEFSPLPAQMFELRSAPDWNRANYFLGTKAAPKAGAIMQILNQMRASQDKLAQMDEENLHSEASYMKVTMVVGTLIVIVVCVLISMMMSRMISVPLKKVVDRAKAIAAGDLTGGEIKVTPGTE